MKSAALAVAAVSALTLQACAVRHDVIASREGDRIVFTDKRGGGRCLSSFYVAAATGPNGAPLQGGPFDPATPDPDMMWGLDGEYGAPPCGNRLPITYGVTPRDMTLVQPARPLQPTVTYTIRGWDRDIYMGAFRIEPDGRVRNVPHPIDVQRD